jgi:hypothetical protein
MWRDERRLFSMCAIPRERYVKLERVTIEIFSCKFTDRQRSDLRMQNNWQTYVFCLSEEMKHKGIKSWSYPYSDTIFRLCIGIKLNSTSVIYINMIGA